MAMRQQNRIELTTFEFSFAAVLFFFFSPALKHSTVNQDARVLCHNVISRASDVTRRTVEMNLHEVLNLRFPIANCRFKLPSDQFVKSAIGNWQSAISIRPAPLK